MVATLVALSAFGLAVFLAMPGPGIADIDPPSQAEVMLAPVLGQPTREQALAFVEKFRAAWLGQDEVAGEAMYDLAKGAELALAGEVLSRNTVEDLRTATSGKGGLAIRTLGNLLDDDTDVSFLRFEEHEHGLWAYFRVSSDRVLEQVGVLLAVVNERVQIVDTWSLQDGRPMSATLREAALAAPLSAADIDAMNTLFRAVEVRDWQGVIEAYAMATPRVRGMRAPQLHRIAAAVTLADPRRERFIRDFQAEFPGDPSGALQIMRLEALAGNSRGAGEAAEELHELVGPDALILAVASKWWLRAGTLERARDAADRAVREEPALEEAWVQRLKVVRAQGDLQEEAATAAELADRFGVDSGARP